MGTLTITNTYCGAITWYGSDGAGNSALFTSSNGRTWSSLGAKNPDPGHGGYGKIVYIRDIDKWVASKNSSPGIVYSSDGGTNWSDISSTIFEGGASKIMSDGNGLFVAAGFGTTNALAYSSNGIDWTGLGTAMFGGGAGYGTGVAYGNGLWVAGAGVGTYKIAYSSNGTTWNYAATTFSQVRDIIYVGGRFIAVGATSDAAKDVGWSTDGINWNYVSCQLGTTGSGITYGKNRLVACGFGGILYSDDLGDSWNTTAISTYYSVIDFDGTTFVASASGINGLWSDDGINWNDIGSYIGDVIGNNSSPNILQ